MCTVGERGWEEVVIVLRARVGSHVGEGRGVVRGLGGDRLQLLVLAVVVAGPAHSCSSTAGVRLVRDGSGRRGRGREGGTGGRGERARQAGTDRAAASCSISTMNSERQFRVQHSHSHTLLAPSHTGSQPLSRTPYRLPGIASYLRLSRLPFRDVYARPIPPGYVGQKHKAEYLQCTR